MEQRAHRIRRSPTAVRRGAGGMGDGSGGNPTGPLGAVRAGTRQGAHGDARGGRSPRGHREAHDLRDRSPRVSGFQKGDRRSLAGADGEALAGRRPAGSEGTRRSRRRGRERGHRGARPGARAMSESRSFLSSLDEATGVATITLNRPDRLNALTFEVYAELRDTFQALDTEPGVRAIVLTGAGRGFCSGGDVEEIIGALFERDFGGLREFTRMTCDLVRNIRKCRRPVIAALNGTAAGAGPLMASPGDPRIASGTAKIPFLFVPLGLSGAAMGIAWPLP